MSYFSNITNDELQYFHGLKVPNFTIKLSDILHQTSGSFDNKLFKIDEIITGTLYRIFPIFYTGTITSTNPDDRIIDDKVLICTKNSDVETYITFISDETEPVQDYMSYGTYFEIGDTLTDSQFNGIVQLLRANTVHKDEFELHEGVTHGAYADYELTIDGLFVDNGIEIVSFTDLKMKLLNPVFKWSTYTLKLKALRISNPNVESDDSTDGKTFIDVSVDLTKDSFVSIPTSDLQTGDVILYDAWIEIKHDKPVIRYIAGLEVTANPSIIQTGDTSDIYAQLKDNNGYNYDINDAVGKTVYFYERLVPSISLSATPNIIQSGGTSDIYATVKDEDGSISVGTETYFYQLFPNLLYLNDNNDTSELTKTNYARVTVSDGALKIYAVSPSEQNVNYPAKLNSNLNFVFECEIAKIGVTQSIALYLKDSTTATGCWFAYEDSTGKWNGGITGSTFSNVSTTTLSVGDKVKIKQENGVITLYHNNNVIYTKTTSLSGDYYVGHYTKVDGQTSREQYVKNIKIIDLDA